MGHALVELDRPILNSNNYLKLIITNSNTRRIQLTWWSPEIGLHLPRRAHINYDDLTNVRFDIPKFYGTSDPEAYFSWVLKVDKIFRVQRFSDKKKVALA